MINCLTSLLLFPFLYPVNSGHLPLLWKDHSIFCKHGTDIIILFLRYYFQYRCFPQFYFPVLLYFLLMFPVVHLMPHSRKEQIIYMKSEETMKRNLCGSCIFFFSNAANHCQKFSAVSMKVYPVSTASLISLTASFLSVAAP